MDMSFESPVGKSRSKPVPEALIYEILDGKPLYRKGYHQVLFGNKTLEEIMGASGLQSAIISYLLRLIFQHFNENRYFVFTNEPGIHIDRRNNLAGDILIFDKNVLRPTDVDRHYVHVPPVVHLEIDISIDPSEKGEMEYVTRKTRRLLTFGVPRVIWIFSAAKSVLVATPDGPWQTLHWDESIELGLGAKFNIGEYLRKEGIEN